eukprot:scaffold57_cov254-Pinguiococcus_pyrenoidosus.AAC.5
MPILIQGMRFEWELARGTWYGKITRRAAGSGPRTEKPDHAIPEELQHEEPAFGHLAVAEISICS